MTDSQKVLPWQAARVMNLDVQISNPSTTLAQQQETVTCDMPACYLPSTILRSNTTQLKVASVVQNPQTRADNRATNESVSMQYCSQHLSTDVHHANSPTKLVWHVLHKSAVHDSDHLLMSWPLDLVERMPLTAPTTPCLACLAAVRATVTDHLSKMHLQATLKCMASYLLAFTLLTAQAAKFLLMIIWVSLAMFATALQTSHLGLGMHRRQIRTPWLAHMTQCVAHMLWLLLMILRHAASSVHSLAAMYSAVMFVKTQHALIMYILIFQIMCAIMKTTPVILLAVRQTMQLMLPHNARRYRKFAHPKLRGGIYWRRIRYIQKKLKSQPLYKLLELLAFVHISFIHGNHLS